MSMEFNDFIDSRNAVVFVYVLDSEEIRRLTIGLVCFFSEEQFLSLQFRLR